jgi:succinate dehydrogenase / fumarate reductase membrane anchor subunit
MTDTTNKHIKERATAHGASEWMNERVMALFSVPLMLWFICKILQVHKSCHENLADIIKQPINAVLLIMFIGFFLYYSTLAMKVVVEDYVHCKCVKLFLILSMKFVGIFSFVASCLAILRVFVA